MRRWSVGLIFVLLVFSLCLVRAESSGAFTRANEAYRQQRFDEAAALYEKVLAAEGESGPLYYNLGNAYFRSGKIGKAVLNYERAMNFIPRDPDLNANYGFAKSVAGTAGQDNGKGVMTRLLAYVFRRQTFSEICWVMIVLVFALAAGHLAALYSGWRQGRKAVFLSAFAVLILWYAAGLVWKTHDVFSRAVMVSAASAYFEPREGATAHFTLREAEHVRVLKSGGEASDWERVRRFDGKIGWVRADMFEKIFKLDRRGERVNRGS